MNASRRQFLVAELEADPHRVPAYYTELESVIRWLMDTTFESTDPKEKTQLASIEMRAQQTVKRQFLERTMASIHFVVVGVMISTLALLAGCTLPCPFRIDGECDDGRAGAVTDLCPLGTDPEDCGPVPPPPSSKCNPSQIDMVPKIAGSLTDFTWKVTTTCAGPLNGIVCFEGGNESLCSANILDTPTINSKPVSNLTSSFAVDFLLPSGAERMSFLYCDSATLSSTTPHTCSDGSAPQTTTVDRQESSCPQGTSFNSNTGDCRTLEGCPADLPFLWSDGLCRASEEPNGSCASNSDCSGFGSRNCGGPTNVRCASDNLCHCCVAGGGGISGCVQSCMSTAECTDPSTFCEQGVCVFRAGGAP